jgi:hypothetical protein
MNFIYALLVEQLTCVNVLECAVCFLYGVWTEWFSTENENACSWLWDTCLRFVSLVHNVKWQEEENLIVEWDKFTPCKLSQSRCMCVQYTNSNMQTARFIILLCSILTYYSSENCCVVSGHAVLGIKQAMTRSFHEWCCYFMSPVSKVFVFVWRTLLSCGTSSVGWLLSSQLSHVFFMCKSISVNQSRSQRLWW